MRYPMNFHDVDLDSIIIKMNQIAHIMKRLLTFLLIFSFAFSLSAQDSKLVQAQLLFAKFYTPDEGPYLETYLSVVGNSVVYTQTESGKFQGKIEITMIFLKDSVVANYDKYELLSPEIDDTSRVAFNFLDQQRFSLPNGLYEYEIIIRDINSSNLPYSATQTIEIKVPEDEISVSGIEMVESYTPTVETNMLSKSGYDLVPYVFNYLPSDVNSLIFYTEIYNADKALGADEQYLLNYFVETYESGKKLNNFTRFKRESAKPVSILFANFNVADLPSGNYNLVVEARDRNNEVLAQNRIFFQRSNPEVSPDYEDYAMVSVQKSFVSNITSKDTLRQYIDYLLPISTNMEMNFIKYQIEKGDGDFELMQRFFLNFWLDRDEVNPEYAWNEYLANVELVNDQFGAPGTKGKRGYQTDMGRVFLKYGPPNTITDRPYDASGGAGMVVSDYNKVAVDGGMVPYQIWHYYTLDNLKNRKFVFSNPHLALSDYQLIHSNFPGEISNANWQAELRLRYQQGVSMPNQDKYGGRSGDYYNNPR